MKGMGLKKEALPEIPIEEEGYAQKLSEWKRFCKKKVDDSPITAFEMPARPKVHLYREKHNFNCARITWNAIAFYIENGYFYGE